MTSHRPFRFGIQAANAASRSEWVSLAQRAEANGYDVLTMPDHFTEQLAPIPALMTVADATTTLRIGALVWDNDYKHPVVLAKELATMDLLSEGRLEVGMGAGWMVTDYEQSGIPYDSPKVRIDRFIEGMAILKGAMSEGTFSYSGTHYNITDYNGLPKPVQRPLPPFLIGGGGKRVLSYAAREADIIGINGTMTAGVVGPDAISTMTAEAVDEKVAIVHAAAGDRMSQIEMNVRAFMVNVTNDRLAVTESFSSMLGVPRSFMEESPFALVGTTDQMIDDLLARRERWGFSYIIVGGEDVESFAPVVAALAGK
ncbi:MAG: TIGR03621 family F420-dependent LLM class oxidoreductase [Actinobacteria bacterium]|jgi:probable F420-dependent oxidoreductase|nr:TIGR03621 family F420-dependent LLM class oxidoreductase [Actinomycetota bacterium]